MSEVVESAFKSLRTVNLTSKVKNVVKGRKCTKKLNWKHYRIKIHAKRETNNMMDNTLNKI